MVEASSGVYKLDVLAGFIDLSDYAKTSDFHELSNSEVQSIWDSVFTSWWKEINPMKGVITIDKLFRKYSIS